MLLRYAPGALAAATALLLSLTQPAVADANSEINVSMKTSFNAAPYLIELLETAAHENSTSYFPLLDRIAGGTFSELQTDRDLYLTFLKVLQDDGHISSAEALSSFKLALSLHAAAPRIEAHYQYYRTAVEHRMMAAQDAVCPVWVHLDGQQYCSPALERAQQPVDDEGLNDELPFDRVLGGSSEVHSILYADITHPLFGDFHQTVSQTAREGKTSYRVRYRPSNEDAKPLFVSGYGVELSLKRTDYIVIDDREAGAAKDEAETKADEDKKSSDLKRLTTSELSRLGLNTASYIAGSEDPINALLDISADFPKHSAMLAANNATKDFLTEHYANRELLLPGGFSVLWMNGLQIQNRDINAYTLLDTIRTERKLIKRLQDIGLTNNEAIDLLSHQVLAEAHADDQPQRYDWRPEEDQSVIMWLNDIEKDSRYASWLPGLEMLLQRTYPGQLPQVRRDIHNLVIPVNFHDINDLDLIVNTLQMLVKRAFPIRVGLVPAGKDQSSEDMTKAAYHLLETYGLGTLMRLFENVVTSKGGIGNFEKQFAAAIKDKQPRGDKPILSYSDVLVDEELLTKTNNLKSYRSRLGLEGEKPPILANGVALVHGENWFESMSQRIYMDHRTLQVAVYEGQVQDGEDLWVPSFFLETAASRRNALIIPENSKSVRIANVAELADDFSETFAQLPRVPAQEATLLSDHAHLLLVADLDKHAGRSLLAEALMFVRKHPETELLLAHNQAPGEALSGISSTLHAAVQNGQDISIDGLSTILAASEGEVPPASETEALALEYWLKHEGFISQLGLKQGESGLWLNGRLIGPLNDDFVADHFESLLEFEQTSRIAPVTKAITALQLEEKFKQPLDLAKITSIVARSLKSDIPEGIYESAPLIRLDKFKTWRTEHTMIHVKNSKDATIQIVAVIDPATEIAQNWLPIIRTLSELEGVDIKVFLNPRDKLTDLPVKRFYRNVINSAPLFNEDGSLSVPAAHFSGLPENSLFNLGMVVPPAWLVSPSEAVYDLDNIKLSSVPTGRNIDAVYELEHILIEGHSRDTLKGQPPRGAQLLLGTEQDPHFTDTIIMANLGYFQFKAQPGHWQISLKPGRSSKIFNIDSVGSKGYAAVPGDEGTIVTLMSFQGATLFPRLSRKPGMEKEDVLESTGLADTASAYLKKGQSLLSAFSIGKKSNSLSPSSRTHAEINIFSVASGHLYERMLNIMMLSVLRHTSHTVKFWFIEQFLSPSFKRSLPHLAEHYNFSYEMVTYKWPHWLRGQKEKQREIWGYKILFLDVLFPLDLDKVIFVDADQIVRTDMMELNRVDLHGAPYGFTPMCDSRTEMEGFRFWKQGYWENYLQGKPYHISALYVVDLKRFRELAAGDRLRGQYHALSADPNSLSNLDQDLPNHMQHNLPIHTLDQDWLWCETWCSDESLARARTIDLCNNPQTKEPKLERARRQVPEWNEYDAEIAEVLRKYKGEGESVNGGSVQEELQKEERRAKVEEERSKGHKIDEL